jgi:phosphoglycolate phosphatase
VINAWNLTLRELNISQQFLPADTTKYVGLRQHEIIKALLPHLTIEECENLGVQFSKKELLYIKQFGGKLFEGVAETLRELSKQYTLHIVSNCQEGYIEAFLDYFDLWAYFQDFESAGRTQKDKSENIKLVKERNKIESCVYVGDTESDFKATKLNNLPFVFANYGFGKVENSDHEISRLSDLKAILLKL